MAKSVSALTENTKKNQYICQSPGQVELENPLRTCVLTHVSTFLRLQIVRGGAYFLVEHRAILFAKTRTGIAAQLR